MNTSKNGMQRFGFGFKSGLKVPRHGSYCMSKKNRSTLLVIRAVQGLQQGELRFFGNDFQLIEGD